MPEYRALREKAGSFLSLCFNSGYAAEVTMQPIHKFGMDAAILFADILLIPMALGQDLKFETGEGPKLGKLAVNGLMFKEEKLQPIYETLKLLTQQLKNSETTLIGFAGAPWTVATYMVEGGSSREFSKAKSYPQMDELLNILVESTSQYLISQIKAGAEVVQIFDSWAGALNGEQFENWVIKPNAKIIENLRKFSPDTPIIAFPKGATEDNLKKFCNIAKPDAISIDSSTSLEWAFKNLNCVIQGNLDPQVLLGDKPTIKLAAEKILKTAEGKPFIFNLGHGIIKETPVENVEFLCGVIRNYK